MCHTHTPYELTPVLSHSHTHSRTHIHSHSHTPCTGTHSQHVHLTHSYIFTHTDTLTPLHTATRIHSHTLKVQRFVQNLAPFPPRLEALASTSQTERFTPTNMSTRCFYLKRIWRVDTPFLIAPCLQRTPSLLLVDWSEDKEGGLLPIMVEGS